MYTKEGPPTKEEISWRMVMFKTNNPIIPTPAEPNVLVLTIMITNDNKT
jgi:hypothetical protein